MSKITSPILLDSTGQNMNETLVGIRSALMSQNALIDDSTTTTLHTWSSQKITEALTVTKTESGSTVTCKPIAATHVIVETVVANPGMLELTQTMGEYVKTYSVYVPAPGRFNFNTGILTLNDGNVANLVGTTILALDGTNTFTLNSGSMDVSYRAMGVGEGGSSTTWDVIFGGFAAEEV